MTMNAFPPEYRQPKHVDITGTIRADVPANDVGPFSIRLVEVGCEGPVFYQPGHGFYCTALFSVSRAEKLERQLDEAGKIEAVKAAFEKLRPLNADEAFTAVGVRVRTAFEFYRDGGMLAYKLPLAGKNGDATKLIGSVAIGHESGLVAGSRRLYTLMCEQLFEYEARTAPRPFVVGVDPGRRSCSVAWRLMYPPKIEFGGPPIDVRAEAEKSLDHEVRAHCATRKELADAKWKIAKLEGYNAQAAQTNRQLSQQVQDRRDEINKLDTALDHQTARVTKLMRALCDVKNGKEPQGVKFLNSAFGGAYGVIEFDR